MHDYLPGRKLKPSTHRELPLHARRPPPPLLRRPRPQRARGAAGADRRLRGGQDAKRTLDEDDPEPPPAPERHAPPRRRLAADSQQPALEHRPTKPRAARDERAHRNGDRQARERLRRARSHEASEDEREWWSLAKAIVLTALGTALRRGELIGLRWGAVNLLEAKIEVRETFVRGRVHNAEEQSVEASRRARPAHARRPRGAVAAHRLPRRRRPRLRPSDEGNAARDRASSRSTTSSRRWRGPGSTSRSARSTTSATRH